MQSNINTHLREELSASKEGYYWKTALIPLFSIAGAARLKPSPSNYPSGYDPGR